MTVIMRNTILSVFALLLFLGLPQTGQTISVVNYNTADPDHQLEIDTWLGNYSSGAGMLEDFEDVDTGWYQSLTTPIGTFSINENTVPGTGSSSYGYEDRSSENVNTDENSNSDAYFEIRDYDADGRKNTSPSGGKKYLDSADISSFTLDVDGEYSYLFFYMTDPSDIEATTRTGAKSSNGDENYDKVLYEQNNGSVWFVGIDAGNADYIDSITWSALLDGDASTDDGFGIDGLSQKVPEPASLLLLGTGLIGLAGFARRRRSAKS